MRKHVVDGPKGFRNRYVTSPILYPTYKKIYNTSNSNRCGLQIHNVREKSNLININENVNSEFMKFLPIIPIGIIIIVF